MSVNYSCIGAVWRCESCLPKGISRGQLPETAEFKGRGLQGRGRRSDKGPITVTEGISERQKKPSVTRSFNRLLLASVLSRHSQELLGIHGHGKEGTVTVSRFMRGVVQLVRAPACHAGGRAFKSRRSRRNSRVSGCTPY
jgi:hypothetical protein